MLFLFGYAFPAQRLVRSLACIVWPATGWLDTSTKIAKITKNTMDKSIREELMSDFLFTAWQPSYSVGNADLDEQHRRLLALCRETIECLADESALAKSRCYQSLSELASFAVEHNKCEEALLKACAYPLLEYHQNEHQNSMQQIHDFLMTAYRGQINKPQLVAFLSEWVADHIVGADKQFITSIRDYQPPPKPDQQST